MILLLPALLSVCVVITAPPPPPRLLLLGDSNMHGTLGQQLEDRFSGGGWVVRRIARSGSGLARPDYWDWFTEGAGAVAGERPDAVVVIFGGNDGQALWSRQGAVRWKDESDWRAEYAARVHHFLTQLSGGVRPVFLLSPTNRRSRSARARLARVRAVQQQVVSGLPLARYVDTWAFTSDLRGHYVPAGPVGSGKRRAPYRRADGVHLTPAGARALLPRLLRALARGGLLTSL